MKRIAFLLLVKRLKRKFYNFTVSRSKNPLQSLFILLLIFLALCINYGTYSSSFIFEVEFFNVVVLNFTFLIPLFLFANSFLFKNNWIKGLSVLAFFILGIITLILYSAIVLPRILSGDGRLVRRFQEPKDNIISVYIYKTYGFHDSGHICKVWVRHKRVFPGILRKKELIHECYE